MQQPTAQTILQASFESSGLPFYFENVCARGDTGNIGILSTAQREIAVILIATRWSVFIVHCFDFTRRV